MRQKKIFTWEERKQREREYILLHRNYWYPSEWSGTCNSHPRSRHMEPDVQVTLRALCLLHKCPGSTRERKKEWLVLYNRVLHTVFINNYYVYSLQRNLNHAENKPLQAYRYLFTFTQGALQKRGR